jgi:hypothetical protein
MAYKEPSSINATLGLQEFLIYASEVTNYWFGNMLLITIFTISLTYYLHTHGTKDFWSGCAIAGYFTFVIALLLWLMNAINGTALSIIIAAVAVFTIALWLNKKNLYSP